MSTVFIYTLVFNRNVKGSTNSYQNSETNVKVCINSPLMDVVDSDGRMPLLDRTAKFYSSDYKITNKT